MTPEEATAIFEGCMALVVTCYMLGLGIGLIVSVMKSTFDSK